MLPGPEIFFRPVHGKSSAKSGKSPANLHIKRKTAFSRRVNKIVNKFFSLSLSVRHYSKRRKFFQHISSATFLPLLTNFGHNSAINSSGQIFFSSAPFELFGRNFGHLTTLASWVCSISPPFTIGGGEGVHGRAGPIATKPGVEVGGGGRQPCPAGSHQRTAQFSIGRRESGPAHTHTHTPHSLTQTNLVLQLQQSKFFLAPGTVKFSRSPRR